MKVKIVIGTESDEFVFKPYHTIDMDVADVPQVGDSIELYHAENPEETSFYKGDLERVQERRYIFITPYAHGVTLAKLEEIRIITKT
jgi:hypothetical protein